MMGIVAGHEVERQRNLEFGQRVASAVNVISALRLEVDDIVAMHVYGGQLSTISIHLEWEAFSRIRPNKQTCDAMQSIEGQYHHRFIAGSVEFCAICTDPPEEQ